jgi:hypothetical protein
MLLFLILREVLMLLVFLLEPSDYECHDGIKHPKQHFFPGIYSNVTPYSSRSKSQNVSKKRSEAFKPLKILFSWSVKTMMG